MALAEQRCQNGAGLNDHKWKVMGSWQIQQLARLALSDGERVESALNVIWQTQPGLFEELAIAAVDQEQLSISEACELIGCENIEIETRLIAFRQTDRGDATTVVEGAEGSVARLADSQVAVWEIIREYRKLGSVERLSGAFPSLKRQDLAAALKYAESHPGEIEALISRYEDILQRRRSEYPFSR